MGKGKLQKFAEYNAMEHTFDAKDTHLKGQWNELVFKNNNPVVLELACGRGEYSVGLAALYPNKNFIGIDIKGARMWKGATQAIEQNLFHVAFLRIQIEMIEQYFEKDEVSEIWIIFPDPQPQESRIKKRLTSPRFLDLYRKIAKKDALVHLKTDSPLLYEYTKEIIAEQGLQIVEDCSNVSLLNPKPDFLQIQTYYEKLWLKEKRIIRFLKFSLNK
ncbi:MAG: tRNA (guanosine(46)-N7)-methyltransferase TrmB [Bacteroidetes bacterium]|nr:tRNA (guanosine(46)-N7)-methyltransferase TrmB [Bacteroidota bacterium]